MSGRFRADIETNMVEVIVTDAVIKSITIGAESGGSESQKIGDMGNVAH